MKNLSEIKDYNDLEEFMLSVYAPTGEENVVIDGPIDLNVYKSSSPKILFFNLECHGYEDGPAYLKKDFDYWIKRSDTRTSRYSTVFVHEINSNLSLIKEESLIPPFNRQYYQQVFKNTDSLIEVSKKIASINFKKKADNPKSSADYHGIAKEAKENKLILLKQLEILSPDIIILGGKVCLSHYKSLVGDESSFLSMNEISVIKGQIIVPIKHMSRPSYSELYLYAKKVSEIYIKLTNE